MDSSAVNLFLEILIKKKLLINLNNKQSSIY